MKKTAAMPRAAMTILLAIGVMFAGFAPISSAHADAPRPILVTAYRQLGWGDAVQIGYVDEAGELWFIEGSDHDLNWPYPLADQLTWLAAAKHRQSLGTLAYDDLFSLNSLVQCVEAQKEQGTPAANDAGTEVSYAVRYSAQGAETILLGESGDTRFENTDATAQALYLYLRTAFPSVTSYFGNPVMAPSGFQPVSLMAFRGYESLDLLGLKVTQNDLDCEAGTEPVLLTDEEAEAVRAQILRLRVVGKHSCIVTTGGSTVYAFQNAEGKTVASFEFYHGLLVTQDGMYAVE